MPDELEPHYLGKSVLVTGGLGFIGSNLAHRLVELGARVVLVDALIPAYGGNLFNIRGLEDRLRINIADVRSRASMNYLVQGHDYFFNLAGTLSHIDSITDPLTDLEINCVSQLAVLESCRKYNPTIRIVFSGTRGQYGRPCSIPVSESAPLRPLDVNGVNNLAAELYHFVYHTVHGLSTVCLRLTNTYGPRHQMRTHKQGIVNWFVRQLLDGKPVRLFGDGSQVRDVSYVGDVVEALLRAMVAEHAAGEAYNVGGSAHSLLEIAQTMIKVLGHGDYECVPFPDDLRRIEISHYVADDSKFRGTTGWIPETDLATGLARTFDFYAAHRQHYW